MDDQLEMALMCSKVCPQDRSDPYDVDPRQGMISISIRAIFKKYILQKTLNFQVTDFQMWDQVLPDEQLVRVKLILIIVIVTTR